MVSMVVYIVGSVAAHRDDAGGDGAAPAHRDVIGFSKIICIDL